MVTFVLLVTNLHCISFKQWCHGGRIFRPILTKSFTKQERVQYSWENAPTPLELNRVTEQF